MKFNIGDRVQTKLNRTPGTVRWARDGMVAVETDDPKDGVPLRGFDIQRGLFLSADAWEKISPSKIVITSDGKTTLARLYDGDRVIRRAEAKCSPEDTYDFATGADLAYCRLMQPSKPTAPANKYDAMSDDELKEAVCRKGTCSANMQRHADCPFKNTPAYNSPTESCSGFLRAHPEFRPVLVQYLVDEDAAKESKPEPKPVKLYCVKDYKPGGRLTRGKTYELRADLSMTMDDGTTTEYDNMTLGGVPFKQYFAKLVARPAKAGEYIMVTNMDDGAYHDGRFDMGDILRVTKDDINIIDQWKGKAVCFKNVTHPDYPYQHCVVVNKDYLVLDGYDGRYEEPEKPKYYGGKVVCVETHDDFTVGKVYTFAQGKVTDDSWSRRPMSSYVAESLEAWNSRCGDCIARFVEYKGEA